MTGVFENHGHSERAEFLLCDGFCDRMQISRLGLTAQLTKTQFKTTAIRFARDDGNELFRSDNLNQTSRQHCWV